MYVHLLCTCMRLARRDRDRELLLLNQASLKLQKLVGVNRLQDIVVGTTSSG